MRLLVTGATGFIGSRLVRTLREQGMEVRCLVRRASAASELERLGLQPVLGDLASGGGIEDAVAGVEIVVHLAGLVRAWTADEYFEVNVEGTRRLAEAAMSAGVRRFVFVSSLAAAGPSASGSALTEDDLPAPVGIYGESKLAAERALAAAARTKLHWSVIRPSIVYGPGDRDVYQLFRLCRLPVVPHCAAAGARISVIHVDDLVDFLILAMDRALAGSVYFASDGESHTWGELIAAISSVLGTRGVPMRLPPLLVWPVALALEAARPFLRRPPLLCRQKLREAAQTGWVASIDRARRELGFVPRRTLDAGVAESVRWYREAGWL